MMRSVKFKVTTDSDVKVEAGHDQLVQLIKYRKVDIPFIKYAMSAEQLERLQTIWGATRKYRLWVLSLPIAMQCDIEDVMVSITFGIRVVVQQRGAYNNEPQWVKRTYNGQYIVETTGVLCAGFRRWVWCDQKELWYRQWLGWNWHWTMEVLSDCPHDFNMLVF
jgi:hypothetical protein